ncbi:MAG: hypothetical protein WD342_16200 [Verrucomicrobiales bacterium]
MWCPRLDEVTVWHVPVSLRCYGWFMPEGDIYIPAVTGARLSDFSLGYHTRLTDVLRHEWAHALADRRPGLVRNRCFQRVFGGPYHSTFPVAEYDPAHHLTPYAATSPGEDFAETFHFYLRHKGRLPLRLRSRTVIALMVPVLEGLQMLTEAGLVHRDVKPDNILFFDGRPSLGDISLLGADAAMVTRRGTPGYVTPSWYLGGHPDMFGAAATLYSLLTGNAPDRMGRSAFLWPPQGKESLTPAERSEWKRLHAVIRRALEEEVSERFVDFAAMKSALSGHQAATVAPPRRRRKTLVAVLGLFGLAAATATIVMLGQPTEEIAEKPPAEKSPAESPELTPDQKADYQVLAGMVLGYTGDGEYANALAAVEELLSTYPQARTCRLRSVCSSIAMCLAQSRETA